MTTPPANGHFPWLWRIVAGVQMVTLGWMGWVSLELVQARADRAVLGSRVEQINRQIGTISVDFMQSQITTLQGQVRALEIGGSDGRGGDRP